MSVDPSQHRILLVGPRVVHLKPFFERRRYNCVAVQKGVEGMTALDAEPRDIVILELNLGDLTATEFLMAARQAHAQASFLLLDDASKAGQIVKALQAGLDGYLPTPPDEDRLFFEVERHLRNANGVNTGETQLVTRPGGGATQQGGELATQLASAESQIVELGMQNDLLQQEISKAREQLKSFNAVKNALFGVLDGDLDAESAMHLKERLAMATVLETEADALREELAGAKNVRRELQDQVDTFRKRAMAAEQERDEAKSNAASSSAMDSIEGAALRDRMTELESENMVLEGRIAELEEELDLSKAEVVALEQKHKADVGDLQRELNRVSSDHALSTGNVERASLEAAATVARLNDEHKDAIARLREEHEASLKRAVSDVEIERATVEQRIKDAVAAERKRLQNEADAERKRFQSEAGGERGALEEKLQAALMEKEQAESKALDIELMLDELKNKISFLEGEYAKERDRANSAEERFKKDKLRLIEEKEAASSGSAEAFNKVQKFIDENAVLKRSNAEFEALRASLEEKARAGEEAAMNAALSMEQAAIIRAEAIQQRDTAESAKRAIEDRCNNLEKKNAALEASIAEERQRLLSAERALGDAGTVNNKLADVTAAKDALEKEAERLGEKLAESEGALLRVQEELESLKKTGGDNDALAAELKERIAKLEDTLLDREAQASEAKEALVTMQGEMEQQRKTLTDHYEERLRAAVTGNPSAAKDALAERDAYRQRLAETEAWVQQAQVHLEALRVERDQLAAQATALASDMTSRGAESQELYAQLAQSKAQIEALTRRAAGPEQELNVARAQAARAASGDPQVQAQLQSAQQAVQQAQDDAQRLRQQLQQTQQQLTQAQGQMQVMQAQVNQAQTTVGPDPRLLQQAQEEVRRLQQQLAMASQQQQQGQQGPDPRAYQLAQEEIRALRGQLQQVQIQMASGGATGRLPEELEPLRWTLTAAIDAITSLEGREPSLGAHLRNLRLLASTLSRLSPGS